MGRLWYKEPASIWEEALPLGNGRIGAMVYGGIDEEKLQVNEESIWYGGPQDRNNKEALQNLPIVRNLLFEGLVEKAEMLMLETMSGTPCGMNPYQTLGEINLTFNHDNVTDYERELDLTKAVARVRYNERSTTYMREYFISKPADCLIVHFTKEGCGKISFKVNIHREADVNDVEAVGDNEIRLCGHLGEDGYEYAMSLRVCSCGGKVYARGKELVVEGANDAKMIFTADSSYHHKLKEGIRPSGAMDLLDERISDLLSKAEKTSCELLLEEHVEDYRALFDSCRLSLGDKQKVSELTTKERVYRVSRGECDINLCELYFDYGRYLLISSSREGGLPATLQGIWNKDINPPWDSKFTININAEMNYWPAESTNLSSCHMPLLELIEKMVPNGRVTARVMYGCRGFVAHHNTDIHGDTAPQDEWVPGTYWVMGAAWLCTHQWTHYLFTDDIDYLQKAYPVMAEAALFFLDFLVEYKGFLVTCPSVSPENYFVLPSGHRGANTFGVTMDNQILRDLFTQCIEAYEILKRNNRISNILIDRLKEALIPDIDGFVSQIKKARERLVPTRISKTGTIMEWFEDYKEDEPGHRHMSHLYGLHPSDQITRDETPELIKAAEATLLSRLSSGGGHTGWSRAWIINFYAKLWKGNEAYENLKKLLSDSTYPNLFDKHPPFQIDGNFGATAAIVEMLFQSNRRRIVLLTALPDKWKSGELIGARIVGNGEISIKWDEGKLIRANIKAFSPIMTDVVYKGHKVSVSLGKGEEIELTWDSFKL